MDITYEEAQLMIQRRLEEYPEVKAFVAAPKFRQTLTKILAFEELDASLLPLIENEVMVVLTFYAPIGELAQNISETTGLSSEDSEKLTTMIEAVLLTPLHDELYAFEYLWENEVDTVLPEANAALKERLDLRPDGTHIGTATTGNSALEEPKPLTREELMNALSGKRTMAGDIEAVRRGNEAPKTENRPGVYTTPQTQQE